MSIEARNISKTFGGFRVLDDVSVHIPAGELVALLGPSGSGKTTLLRIIAGLEAPDGGSGEIRFHDENVAEQSVRDRRVGFVFQHYALFRHMNVFENVAFGLRVRPRRERPSRGDIQKRVSDLLRLVQLDWLGDRYPSQLSGGQRQRVALARALAVEPKVLLLDEPFGALDAKVRQELRRWLRRLHDELHVTSVFVTHDQEEALEVSDRVVVLNAGRVEQVGPPAEVFHRPANEFVMNFLGQVNVFHGRVENGRARCGPLDVAHGETRDAPARVLVRPHELDVLTVAPARTHFAATVTHVNAAGPQVKIELKSDRGETVFAEMPHERFRMLHTRTGARVFVAPREVRVFVDEPDDLAADAWETLQESGSSNATRTASVARPE